MTLPALLAHVAARWAVTRTPACGWVSDERETEMNEQQIKNAARELVECEGTEPEFLSVTEMWPDATEDEWDRIYDMARTAGENLWPEQEEA